MSPTFGHFKCLRVSAITNVSVFPTKIDYWVSADAGIKHLTLKTALRHVINPSLNWCYV